MARYLFRRKKKMNYFLNFSLLVLVSIAPAIILEYVEAEKPHESFSLRSNF